MRHAIITLALVAALTSTLGAQENAGQPRKDSGKVSSSVNTPAPGANPEDDPKTAEMRKVFDEFFGQAIKQAQATPDPQDDGRLAEAIYEQAHVQSKYPGFVAYAMDYAVALSEKCPGKRHVAYAALADQVQMGIRPATACYEKMMALGPQVYDEIPAGDQRVAWSNQWQADATAYADLLLGDIEYGRAHAALSGVRNFLGKRGVSIPAGSLDGVLVYLKGLDDQRAAYQADLAAGKSNPGLRIFLGVLALAKRDRDQAALHLAAGGDQAKAFLAAVKASDVESPTAETSLAVARAAGALADQAGHPWIKAVLLKEGAAKAVAAAAAAKEGPDKLRGDLLKDRLQERLAKAVAALPPGVSECLPTLLGPKASAAPVGAKVAARGNFTFFGAAAGQGNNIVYVVDRSGSTTDSIMYVKYELKRSIKELKPAQKFFVVFYSSGPPVGMRAGKSVPATEVNKAEAYKFIEGILPIGQTDPSEALKLAFATGADTIMLLTDGEFEKKVVALIDTLNAGKKVTVNTVCFLYTGGEAILQEIAKKNNGQYTYVGEQDLEKMGK